MPENQFDKRVQEEMQAFRVKPSEAVWPLVEERIRKRKKRRFIFLLFILAGLGVTGFFTWDSFSKSDSVQVTKNRRADSDQTNSANIPADQNQAESYSDLPDNNLIEEKISDVKKENDRSALSLKSPKSKQTQTVRTTKDSDLNTTKEEVTDFVKTEKQVSVQQSVIKEQHVETKSDDQKEGVNQKRMQDDNSDQRADELKISEQESVKDSIEENIQTQNPDLEKQVPEKIKKNWNWGFQFSPGFSNMAEGIFPFAFQKAELNYTGSPGGSGGSAPAPPSDRKSGLSFQSGVFAQRDISDRLKLSLGLQYSYYSDRIRIGNRNDSVLNSGSLQVAGRNPSKVYAAAPAVHTYTNPYHFIEFSTDLNYRLSKKSGKAPDLLLGLKLGRMLGNNALAYDTAFGGIYLNRSRSLTSFQAGMGAGIQWTVAAGKNRILLGPLMEFNLTPILKSDFENNRYLFRGGLRVRYLFTNKK